MFHFVKFKLVEHLITSETGQTIFQVFYETPSILFYTKVTSNHEYASYAYKAYYVVIFWLAICRCLTFKFRDMNTVALYQVCLM